MRNKNNGSFSLSITIPALNEEKTLKNVFENAYNSVSALTRDFEILFVDDGSTDTTGVIMHSLKCRYPNHVTVIHHKHNSGFSGAMNTCYKHASKELIFLGPADGQFDYSQLKLFIQAYQKNKCDIVLGYRSLNEESLRRKIYSYLFHLLCKLLFAIRFREFSSCILYSKKVRNEILIQAHPYSILFLPELVYKSIKKGYVFSEVPIQFKKRIDGSAKGANPYVIIRTLKEMITFWINIKRGYIY